MYSIEFTKSAEKQLSKLDLNFQERVIEVLERIRIRPHHFIKRKEGTPYFILRVGEHRLILQLDNTKQVIFVIELGHRKSIYD